ncbi:MAG: hypothetical protein ACRENL_04400 [Candidatus Dormibacteria bacterium]
MPDHITEVDEADHAHQEHPLHLPPPSFVPISVALALAMTFVGFIDQVRGALGPLIWGIGLLWLITSCVVWYLAARTEFHDLPESLDPH